MKFTCFCIFVLSFMSAVDAQEQAYTDTVIYYDLGSSTYGQVPPIAIDPDRTWGRTASYPGSIPNYASLPVTLPTENVFSGSNFTDLSRAASKFDVTAYPLRTAVTFKVYYKGEINIGNSGMLVGNDFVISAAHCFVWDHGQYDSIVVLPAFDNGALAASIPACRVDRIFYPKTFKVGNKNDAILMHLERPVGNELGWVGLAFEETTASSNKFYDNKIFHKFSYPGTVSPFDSTRVYNGDTMYHNYGEIEVVNGVNSNWLGVNSLDAKAIPGMSGGPVILLEHGGFQAFGIAIYSHNYMHLRFHPPLFFALENILKKFTTSVTETDSREALSSVFPNPFSDRATVTLPFLLSSNSNVRIIDCAGAAVPATVIIHKKTVAIERGQLEPGLYFIEIDSDGRSFRTKVMVL